MQNRKGEECPWHSDAPADQDLGRLQAMLNCASVQGCLDCVPCSERALELFRETARRRAGA